MATSLANAQRSLRDASITYPLWPPLLEGCPRTSTSSMQYPLEVAYADARGQEALFTQSPLPGLGRWAPLLPPLADSLGMGEGGTPLVAVPRLTEWTGLDRTCFIKDESQNPTWSHKDRLNLCAVSAAVGVNAPGVVVASSGNHGASAAAYAARAGLPCIVLASAGAPPAVQSFLLAYGAAVLGLPRQARWQVMRQIVDRLGYHPVSNLTPIHTGHPFGAEGYKTIAYELFVQLGGRMPAAVFVPTGYGELLFGVWKGFVEVQELGLADTVPRMAACEPAVRAPLAQALATGQAAATVEAEPTAAYSIGVTVNGYRGVIALQRSGGFAVTVSDAQMTAAQETLAHHGMWLELSSAASVAGLREAVAQGHRFDGPVVCLATSSGFKDLHTGRHPIPEILPDWPSVRHTLQQRYGFAV